MADLTKRSTTAGRAMPPNTAPAPARFIAADRCGQLTYTSFDDGALTGRGTLGGPMAGQRSHGGGWQVKQIAGEIDPAHVEELIARIVTRFDLEPALPAFPTPDQIANRPARLCFAADDDGGGRGAYWHTVDAGRDGTGRPGNVFAHVLTQGPGGTGLCPIELWRWAGWLIPYGPEAVKAAVLPAGPPALVGNLALSVQSTVAFLLDAVRDRTGVVRVLLDAVSARLSGQTRGPVVLAVDDHDRAAAWIAAVSHFLTPAGANRLCWSTHEAPESVAAGAAAGLHLVGVPRARSAQLAGHPGVTAVIDENEEPYLGDPESAHRLAAGTVAVTALSVLAEAVLADHSIALRVLARRDAVAADFEGSRQVAAAQSPGPLAPEWPIAVAVLEEPQLIEFHPDAAAVVVDEAPAHLAAVDWAADLVATVLRRHPPAPDEALRRLGSAARRGRGTELLAAYVLRGALADPAWLDRCDLAAVPAVGTARLGSLRAEIGSRFDALGTEDPVTATRAALRLAEMIERLAAPDDDLAAVRDEVAATTSRAGFAAVGTLGWEDALDAGQISEAVLARYVRPVFAHRPAGQLAQLPAETALWLYGAADGLRYARPAPGTADDDYLFGFTTLAVLAAPELDIPADARAHYAAEAIRGALRTPRLDDAQCRDLVAEIVVQQRPAAADLLEFATAGARVPPQILDSLVFNGEVDDESLRAVLAAAEAAPPELVAAAWLRLVRRTGAVPDRDRWCASVAVLANLAPGVPQPGPVPADTWVARAVDELVVMTAAGFVVGQSVGAHWADPGSGFCTALRARMTGAAGGAELYPLVVGELARAERAWILDTAWLVGDAVTVAMGLPGAGAGPLDGFGSPAEPEHGRPVPWSQSLIEARAATGDYRGPTDVIGLRDAAWLVVRGLGAASAEQFFAEYRSVAADWLVRTGVAAQANGPAAGLGGLG